MVKAYSLLEETPFKLTNFRRQQLPLPVLLLPTTTILQVNPCKPAPQVRNFKTLLKQFNWPHAFADGNEYNWSMEMLLFSSYTLPPSFPYYQNT